MLLRSSLAIGVFTALMGVAANVWQFFAFRALMCVFAGFSSAAVALVASQVPAGRLGYALGWLSTGQLVGSLVGQLLGVHRPTVRRRPLHRRPLADRQCAGRPPRAASRARHHLRATASATFLGNSLGPLTGGAVAAAFGLRWVFLVTAAVLLVNLLWVYYRVPEYVDRQD